MEPAAFAIGERVYDREDDEIEPTVSVSTGFDRVLLRDARMVNRAKQKTLVSSGRDEVYTCEDSEQKFSLTQVQIRADWTVCGSCLAATERLTE
ncbi:hypothetical protein [Halocatena marina]|uniref:hypothetical protein n=1 Tax=Halocatena marina TaxID=2934937 RepID=UPI00200C9E9B|nr:hypothetical protein [Halocatena marina]